MQSIQQLLDAAGIQSVKIYKRHGTWNALAGLPIDAYGHGADIIEAVMNMISNYHSMRPRHDNPSAP